MPTDLSLHIQNTPLADTHEHLNREKEWVENGPADVLQDLFGNYVAADLVSAGASPEAVKRLMDGSDPDLEARFAGVREAWEAVRFTGYGEAVRLLARAVYGMEELGRGSLREAQARLHELRRPGERLRLLREVANLDHTQTDDFAWSCEPDDSGPDFFLYDLSWRSFCCGTIEWDQLAAETGITVSDLASLRQAAEAIFVKYAPCAIAVKSQHAYNRTLAWQERSDGEAGRALQALLAARRPEDCDEALRLCLGDWCWARGLELAAEHNLPFKIHTGYYAGTGRMPVDYIRAGNLWELMSRFSRTRFVLMHIAYPYSDELVALVKRYPNAHADLCWAWSINPQASAEFVRRFLHAAPANKLFAFGGDTRWPTSALAYAIQARGWLAKTLESEVADGSLTEREAIEVATRLMRANQHACFDVEGTRAAIRASSSRAGASQPSR
jgi:predicted TIM-barrel fold metal-dependent hydrolase